MVRMHADSYVATSSQGAVFWNSVAAACGCCQWQWGVLLAGTRLGGWGSMFTRRYSQYSAHSAGGGDTSIGGGPAAADDARSRGYRDGMGLYPSCMQGSQQLDVQEWRSCCRYRRRSGLATSGRQPRREGTRQYIFHPSCCCNNTSCIVAALFWRILAATLHHRRRDGLKLESLDGRALPIVDGPAVV